MAEGVFQMKNLIKLLGLIALAAVIGFSMTACPNPADSSSGSSTPDPWTNVTNFSQVNGTWLAPSSNTASLNGMTITQTFTNYRVTFNASAKTMAVTGSSTSAFSGGSIASQWASFKADINAQYTSPPLNTAYTSITFNDTAHSYTITGSGNTISMSDAELQSNGFKINQNGTELKAAYGGSWEIIYTKVS
jgi:hypothetical protein